MFGVFAFEVAFGFCIRSDDAIAHAQTWSKVGAESLVADPPPKG